MLDQLWHAYPEQLTDPKHYLFLIYDGAKQLLSLSLHHRKFHTQFPHTAHDAN